MTSSQPREANREDAIVVRRPQCITLRTWNRTRRLITAYLDTLVQLERDEDSQN